MAHYALLDENNIVINVITGIDEDNTTDLPEDFNSWEEFYGNFHNATCKRTSYNTYNNKHYILTNENKTLSETQEKAYRGNYAGIGFTYDETNDVFIPPQPFDSWILNQELLKWQAPIEEPILTDEDITNNKRTKWDEDNQTWIIFNIETNEIY